MMRTTQWPPEVDQHRHWWLVALLLLAAIFIIGVRATATM
jgi:hypothetical protein